MSTIYELGNEFLVFKNLYDELTESENGGEEKVLSQEDFEAMKELFNKLDGDIESKINNICRYVKNLNHEAEIAETERKSFKSEIERLSRTAKAKENKAKNLKQLISYLLEKMGQKKYKTNLFSLNIQNTQKSIKTIDYIFDVEKLPEWAIKKELNISKIKEKIEEGLVYEKYDPNKEAGKENNPLDKGKLFFKESIIENGKTTYVEKELEGILYLGGEALFIR